MALSDDRVGSLMERAIQGHSFEECLAVGRGFTPAGVEEARELYEDTIETHKGAVAAGGSVCPIRDW